MKNIQQLEDQIYHCSRCGLCQAVCPVYDTLKTEVSVARGKISLMQAFMDGKLEFTPKIAQIMELCTACGACKEACPSGIASDEIFLAAKEHAASKYGLTLPKQAIIKAFSSRPAMGFFSSMLGLYSFVRAGHIADTNIPLPFMDKIKLLNSQIKGKTSSKLFNINIKQKKPAFKLIYFPGCINKYVNSSVANATINVLKENNCDIITLKEFACCGKPAKSFGAIEEAKKMALENLKVFEKCDLENKDYIVVDCASCGHMLKHYTELFTDNTEIFEKIEKISSKIIDINELLVKLEVKLSEFKKELTVTYHDPCHLRRMQGVYKEPRYLIENIKGINFVEMEGADTCCGAAGSFCITQSDISKKISIKKAQNIIETKSDIVLTSCPSCNIGIAQGLLEFNKDFKVHHPVELIYKLGLKIK